MPDVDAAALADRIAAAAIATAAHAAVPDVDAAALADRIAAAAIATAVHAAGIAADASRDWQPEKILLPESLHNIIFS